MRLPALEDGNIDEPVATAMIRHAIDCGVNYIDTAYPYHEGRSEPFVGKVLADGYREKVNLATKLPSWAVTSREDMDRYLNEQLDRLGTDHIDFYLVHGLMDNTWETTSRLGVLEFLDDAVADGRIRYPGFSFHDRLPLFKEIVDAYDWMFAQIQYNFMDEQYQAGTEGLEYASRQGLGIVVMEPLRGGLITRENPVTRDIFDTASVRRSSAAWGLRWVWDHPEVTVVLSGMSTMGQVTENLMIAEGGVAGSLSREEHKIIGQVRDLFHERVRVTCTGCGYCMPCPNGVSIPDCFDFYNQAYIFDDKALPLRAYTFSLAGFFDGIPGYASCCLGCGKCEDKCPQGLPIMELLREVAAYFGK